MYLVHMRLVEGDVVMDFGESSKDFALCSSPKAGTLRHIYCACRFRYSIFITYISNIIY